MSLRTKLANRIDVDVPPAYDNPVFKRIVEMHLTQLIRDESNTILDVPLAVRQRWIGNYNGLLAENNIPAYLHWVVTRVNGLHSSLDYDGESPVIIIPNTSRLNRLRELFATIHNI